MGSGKKDVKKQRGRRSVEGPSPQDDDRRKDENEELGRDQRSPVQIQGSLWP